MLKLMKLEIKKHGLFGYIKAAVIAVLCIMALMAVIIISEKVEGSIPFTGYAMAFTIINGAVRATFLVFSAVFIMRLFIDEYKKGTMAVMFMYPIKRRNIMIAKILVIMLFTTLSILVSNLIVGGFFYIADSIFGIIDEQLTTDILVDYMKSTVINALTAAGMCLIPLYIGLRKKSAPSVFVTALLIASFFGSTSNEFSLFSITVIPVSVAVIGLILAYFSIRNVETADVS